MRAAQQFGARRVAGRLFSAGMQYWQLGESHYWGHNAIILRTRAVHASTARLAPIPGKRRTFGGEILSHDFVEAALMRRAGYHVWLVQRTSRRQLRAAARRTCSTNCSATAAGARATCRTPA